MFSLINPIIDFGGIFIRGTRSLVIKSLSTIEREGKGIRFSYARIFRIINIAFPGGVPPIFS